MREAKLVTNKKWNEYLADWRLWAPPAILAFFLVLLEQHSFLAFHTLAEFSAIVIAFTMFAFAWYTYDFTRNNFLFFLACGYFWIGSLDLMHALAFRGMNVFVEGSDNLSVQIWIVTRYAEALLLLAAPFAGLRKQNKHILFTTFGFITIGLASLIWFGVVPTGYVEGTGLTDFKIYSEYVIDIILLGALVTLIRYRRERSKNELVLIAAAILTTMLAQLAFTFYVDVYGPANLVGHIFKLFSFWWIFQAVVIIDLRKPYWELVREKTASNAQLAKIERQERRFEAIFNAISDGVVLTDTDRRIVAANKGMETIFGYKSEELEGRKTAVLYEGYEEFERVRPGRFGKPANTKSFDANYRHKNGQIFVGETLRMAIEGADGKVQGYVAVIRDVTDRKKNEETLWKMMTAAEQSPASIVITDTLGVIEYVNPKFEKISGYSKEEVIGKNPRFLKSEETSAAEYKKLWQAITSGKAWHGKFHNKHKDGSLYWESVTISPIRNASGRTTHFIAVKEDIGDLVKSEEILRRAQKMEAVGQLTGGIAHDFNNILGIVIGNLEILRRLVVDNEKASGRVDVALRGAKRGANLTAKLLAFSRKDAHQVQFTAIDKFIANMDELLVRSLTVAIHVEYQLDDNLWQVELDPGELQDAILNLTLNAGDAMPDGGDLVIRAANKIFDDEHNELLEVGEYVMLSVSDTGRGMTKHVRDRALDPFFTTKENGTGLGLSMVYGFVKRSKGHMKISSVLGEGTTVRLYLPRAVADGKTETNLPIDTVVQRGDETVLIVDDEKQLLDIAVSYLEDLGYRTVIASGGKQALNILQNDIKIDVLFSDVVMPGGMDGFELANKAREQRPKLKVLLTSGYMNRRKKWKKGDEAFNTELMASLLPKPSSQADLAIAIRRVLDELD